MTPRPLQDTPRDPNVPPEASWAPPGPQKTLQDPLPQQTHGPSEGLQGTQRPSRTPWDTPDRRGALQRRRAPPAPGASLSPPLGAPAPFPSAAPPRSFPPQPPFPPDTHTTPPRSGTISSGLRMPNWTRLMVRNGQALSPEGGPPCMVPARGTAASRRLSYSRIPSPSPFPGPPVPAPPTPGNGGGPQRTVARPPPFSRPTAARSPARLSAAAAGASLYRLAPLRAGRGAWPERTKQPSGKKEGGRCGGTGARRGGCRDRGGGGAGGGRGSRYRPPEERDGGRGGRERGRLHGVTPPPPPRWERLMNN